MTASTVLAADVTLSWDPVVSSSLDGYTLHYGTSAGNYTHATDTGKVNTYTVQGLPEGATYYFAVTAYDAADQESGYSNSVSVYVPYTAPVAGFSSSTTSGTAPLAMNFVNTSTGTISSHLWTFGDGNTSSAKSPSHVYSSAGVYTVSLKVTGPGGTSTKTSTNHVTVTAPSATAPVAAFTADKRSGTAPLTVKFTSSSTGNITGYTWTFGDGTTSTAENPSKTYSSPGTYSVSLRVTGPGGSNTRTSAGYITVSAPTTAAPVAAFSTNRRTGAAPLTAQFTSNSTGTVTGYAWSFGDGTTSTLQNPVKVYSTPGTYTVSLKVSGPGGTHTKTSQGYVNVGHSLWPTTAKPTIAADPDTNAVELGVKFKSDRVGQVTGIRFYKSSANTGTHVGSLWTSSGTLLARATFSNESSSGWQKVEFTTPVTIAANTVYIASYHTNVGRYAGDNNYFATKGVDSGPLHALRDGASGSNGVYRYGRDPTFPNNSYRATNYWVDVLFR